LSTGAATKACFPGWTSKCCQKPFADPLSRRPRRLILIVRHTCVQPVSTRQAIPIETKRVTVPRVGELAIMGQEMDLRVAKRTVRRQPSSSPQGGGGVRGVRETKFL